MPNQNAENGPKTQAPGLEKEGGPASSNSSQFEIRAASPSAEAVADFPSKAELEAFNRTQRLGMAPELRIALAAASAGLVGLVSGSYRGWNIAALRYLAENAHRMPRTKGAWYFYYKRKNYVVMKDSMVQGFKGMAKYGSAAGLFFGVEAYLDKARGTIDLFNTVASAGVVGVLYGMTNQLAARQVLRSARSFMLFGFAAGIGQDMMRYFRGNNVWYLPQIEGSEAIEGGEAKNYGTKL